MPTRLRPLSHHELPDHYDDDTRRPGKSLRGQGVTAWRHRRGPKLHHARATIRPPAPRCSVPRGRDPTAIRLPAITSRRRTMSWTRIWGPWHPTASTSRATRRRPGPTAARSASTSTTSIGSNTWGFTSFRETPSPNPEPPGRPPQRPPPRRRARVRRSRSAGARHGRRRAVGGRATLRAAVSLPAPLAAGGRDRQQPPAAVRARGTGELDAAARQRSAATAQAQTERAAPGASPRRRPGRRRVRVALRRAPACAGRARRCGSAAGGSACRGPATPCRRRSRWRRRRCELAVAAASSATAARAIASLLIHRVRCARDARGNVEPARRVSRPRSYPAAAGLAVTLRGPRRVRPGSHGQVRHARTQPPPRRPIGCARRCGTSGSTPAAPREAEIRELRRGRSRTLRFTRGCRASRATLLHRRRGHRPRGPRCTGPCLRAGRGRRAPSVTG